MDGDALPEETEMSIVSARQGLPKAIEDVFVPLRNEITFLHGNWEVFQQLFQSPDSAEAIQITAGGFLMIRYVFRHEP